MTSPILNSDHSADTFKTRLRKHLMSLQSESLKGNDFWSPCNYNLFSDVIMSFSPLLAMIVTFFRLVSWVSRFFGAPGASGSVICDGSLLF